VAANSRLDVPSSHGGAVMNAKEAKRDAQAALEFMRANENCMAACYGYAWASFARIAGKPGLPLPHEARAKVPS
jgi:hypothetical protein